MKRAAVTGSGEILRAIVKKGLPEAELLTKRGRSRRLELSLGAELSGVAQEKAWAVRAGTRRNSFFAAGTGEPPLGPWPEPTGRPLRLPEPEAIPPWNEPSDLDSPLLGEREGLKLLESLGTELATELPRARLLSAVLEDGASQWDIVSTRGVKVSGRSRISTLYLEAVGPGSPAPTATLYLAAREARQFHPSALARRLADRLAVTAAGAPPERDGGEFLLAPPVVSQILCGLLPLFVGPEALTRAAALRDSRGRIGSDRLTLIDDGRFPGGTLEAATDGEGMPTREVVLAEAGSFRQPLLTWWQTSAQTGPGMASGCVRRAGWRDIPQPGPTHLYLKPDPRAAVSSLLGAVARGYYLIDVTGPGRFDLAAGLFALPVCGFAVQAGNASAPVSGAWLTGGIGAFLKGIAAVGRDLAFHPLKGMIGAPTTLVTGLELQSRVG